MTNPETNWNTRLVVKYTDGQGDHWIATYTMERQKDKSWRISGCTLAPQRGRMA